MLAVETLRHGAFDPVDAGVVGIFSVTLVAASYPGSDAPARRRATLCLLGFVGWWLCTAIISNNVAGFLPLGSSMLAFAAALVVVGGLGTEQRRLAAVWLALVGTVSSILGLLACVTRWYPLAIPAQGLWRLAGTLTYSNAAGLLVGMSLLVLLGLRSRSFVAGIGVGACAAALIASQSRGAALSVLVGALLIPFASILGAVYPLLAGGLAGLLVVATSHGGSPQPVVAAGVIGALLVGALLHHIRSRLTGKSRRVTLVAGVVVVCVLCAVTLLSSARSRLGSKSWDVRMAEWLAAWRQFLHSPLVGVGPNRILLLHSSVGTIARFAHNEYLQVLADAGLVGGILLLLSIWLVVSAVRRCSTLQSSAAAALVAFGIAGSFDFDWHLPALGLLGGWVAGLASPVILSTTCCASPNPTQGGDHL